MYITKEELCYLTDWEIPDLEELKKTEGTLIDLISKSSYQRPGFIFMKRKLPNDKIGRIWLAKQGVDKMQYSTAYGIVLSKPDCEAEDYDANQALKHLEIGDVISFSPDVEPKRFPVECRYTVDANGIRRPSDQDIWVIHLGDILQIYKIKENYTPIQS